MAGGKVPKMKDRACKKCIHDENLIIMWTR